MAKEKKDKEQLQREQAEKAKEKEKKLKEQAHKKRVEKAKKRIDKLVKIPIKNLFNGSILSALIGFIYFFFWLELNIITTLLFTFFVFTVLFVGIGIAMGIYYYFVSEEKVKELNLRIEEDKKRKEEEERIKQQQEMEELEAIERELLEKRNMNKPVETNKSIINDQSSSTVQTQPNQSRASQNQFSEDDYLNEILSNEFNNG